MEVFPGVAMDPAVKFGKPCIAGTRIDVATAINDLGTGETIEAVQEAYALTRSLPASGSRVTSPPTSPRR